MSPANGDRNLLFGVLALQMDFINRDALVKAMHAWVLDKSKPLGQILTEQGALSESRRALLEPLVQEHIHQHGGDAGRSLAAVSSVGSAREELKRIADPDVQASLINLPTTDPNLTKYPSAGENSAVGRRFLILRPHAEGGLGKVSVALDGELNREVALKEIHEQYADHTESRSRFLLEAEITGGLEHPSIVPVYGLGQYEDGRPFYAMRFIRGDSLKEAIERFHKTKGPINAGKRALELRQLLGRFNDVCDAVAYAHSRGVLHRDLKPGNVMLGKYGETLVVDWGLAKPTGAAANKDNNAESPLQPSSADGSAPTQMGSAIGTPQFMPPEQAAGRLDQMGPASDVYSLGATLYCLLTGKPPFTDREVGVVLQKVQRGDFPPPRQVRREIPPALEAICLKAMALRPADRYATARALAGDIEKWSADEPVSAYREPWRIRAGRWARRNQTLVAATTAGFLVAILGGGAGALWYQHDRSMRAAERASKAAATERDVTAALDEARTLGKQAATLTNDPVHWEAALLEALSAVKQAEGLVNSGEGTDDLRGRVNAKRQELEASDKDRRMIARLEDARLQGTILSKGGRYDFGRQAEYYGMAFEDDMRLSSLNVDQAADTINKRTIREELLAALDDWSSCTQNAADQQRLLDILKATDPDDGVFRNRWNAAIAKKDLENLQNLASGPEAVNQPAYITAVIGSDLLWKVGAQDAVRFLKRANERHPGDFWTLFRLAQAYTVIQPPQLEDAMRYYTAALALRPRNSFLHNNLGEVLTQLGKFEEAGAELRTAIQLDAKLVPAHHNLGLLLYHRGRREEAAAELRIAIQFDSKMAEAYSALGLVLGELGKREEAVAELRTAIQLDPKSVSAHNNLGLVLNEQGKREEAADQYRTAIQLDPKKALVHNNLGNLLSQLGKREEAAAELRTAIQLDANFAAAHNSLGIALYHLGKREEAAAEFRTTIRLEPKDSEHYGLLGVTLLEEGQFSEAMQALQRRLELMSLWDSQRKSASEMLQDCVQMIALDKKLPAVLTGQVKPASTAEQVGFALLCLRKKRYADAAHFYADAFSTTPTLAGDLQASHRPNAARAAILAAAGRGINTSKLTDEECLRLRHQALDWFKADLARWSKLAGDNTQARVAANNKVKGWQADSDLASVRDAAALEKLPEAERAEWKKLWADVADLLKKCNGRER